MLWRKAPALWSFSVVPGHWGRCSSHHPGLLFTLPRVENTMLLAVSRRPGWCTSSGHPPPRFVGNLENNSSNQWHALSKGSVLNERPYTVLASQPCIFQTNLTTLFARQDALLFLWGPYHNQWSHLTWVLLKPSGTSSLLSSIKPGGAREEIL